MSLSVRPFESSSEYGCTYVSYMYMELALLSCYLSFVSAAFPSTQLPGIVRSLSLSRPASQTDPLRGGCRPRFETKTHHPYTPHSPSNQSSLPAINNNRVIIHIRTLPFMHASHSPEVIVLHITSHILLLYRVQHHTSIPLLSLPLSPLPLKSSSFWRPDNSNPYHLPPEKES